MSKQITEKVLQCTLPYVWSRLVYGDIIILDNYINLAPPTESGILEKYICQNKIHQSSFVRQPTAYIVKKNNLHDRIC